MLTSGREPSAAMTTADLDLMRAAELMTASDAGDLLDAACRASGTELVGWRLRSVHHRGRRSVSVVYEATLATGDERRDVLLVAHVDTRGAPEGAVVLEGEGQRIAVWRFPHDPYLTGLPAAVHRRRVRELLDELGAPLGDVRLHTRAYRPSRRAVVEVTLHGGDAIGRILYLEVLSGGRAEELAAVHRQLGGVVPVPGVVGVGAAQGILALEAMPGATLRSALVDGHDLPAAEEVVGLAERIAACGLETRRDPIRFADPGRHVDLLRRLVPDAGSALVRAADAAAAVTGTLVGVHGDLHDGQVLVEEGAVVGLLDVDGAGTGLMAQDLGGLLAHLEVVGEVWPRARERAGAYAAEVAAAASRLVGWRQLARGAAGAWLGLATGPYRAQDPDWPQATRHRIAQAESWAAFGR